MSVTIALDGFGGDSAPEVVIEALHIIAHNAYEFTPVVVGDREILENLWRQKTGTNCPFQIAHAPDKIAMDEDPLRAIRSRRKSSITVGLELVRDRKAHAFVSAGSTGAIATAATILLGRQPSVRRPALAQLLPRQMGFFVLLDVGAFSNCAPEDLLLFGKLGAAYHKRLVGSDNPAIALLNIGTESGKGDQLRRRSFELFQKSELNFIGNIEPHELWNAAADVVVTDGFTGNAVLKMGEGVIQTIVGALKGLSQKNLKTKLLMGLLQDDIRTLFKPYRQDTYGGSPLLGLNGICLICHGRSDAATLVSALHTAQKLTDNATN